MSSAEKTGFPTNKENISLSCEEEQVSQDTLLKEYYGIYGK